MSLFYPILEYISATIYKPIGSTISAAEEEKQNANYGGGKFNLFIAAELKSIRFRVAKRTPCKSGQFVSFWQKDSKDINKPYNLHTVTDLLVIHTFHDNRGFGQFIFPKNVSLEKGVIQSETTTGKMAMRVYPSWDKPNNKTALLSQSWQLNYFFEVSDIGELPIHRILELYTQ